VLAGGGLLGARRCYVEVENYEGIYRLCYVRGPEGIIVELAERIGLGLRQTHPVGLAPLSRGNGRSAVRAYCRPGLRLGVIPLL
jgi:hypothetical protein